MADKTTDETPLTLTPDAERVALGALVEVMDCVRQLHSDIRGHKLEVGMRKTLCSLLEFRLADLFKAVGYDGTLAAEVEERYREVREANAEVHRLKQLIGSSRGFDGVPELLCALSREMHSFWHGLGFALVHDDLHSTSRGEGGGFAASYGSMRYRATLCPMLGTKTHSLVHSDTPVTDEQDEAAFLAQMQERYDLAQERDGARDWLLLDTERNRATIRTALKERFPSLLLVGWDSRHLGSGDERFMLWGCDILIRNCADLLPREVQP